MINKLTISNILYYNILSLPILLITGPFLPDLLLSINAITYLFIIIKSKNYNFFKIRVIQILIITWILFIISSIFSEYKLYSLKTSLTYFRFILFLGSMYHVKEKLLQIDFVKFISFILPVSVISFDVIFQSIFGFNMIGLVTWDPSRNSSFFGDEFISGSYIVRTLPLGLLYLYWYLENKKNDKLFYLIFIFLLLCTISTFLSGERTAFFLVLLFNFYFFLCFGKFSIFRSLFLIVLILSITSILVFNKTIYYRMVTNTINDSGLSYLISTLKKQESINISKKEFLNNFSPHLSHYYAAILIYKDNKIFGMGPKNFRKICKKDPYILNSVSCSSHPHSTWIQILSETGILPFIILNILFFIVIKNSIMYLLSNFKKNINNKNNEKVIILGGILLTLWPLIPSGNFFNNWLSIVYFLPVGFYILINEK